MIERVENTDDHAEKENKAKINFLSNMTNEIRTPLNTIIGLSQGLLEEDLSENAISKVNNILNTSENILQIVNGILDISKIEENKLEIINTEYNFKEVFDELITLVNSKLGDNNIQFIYNYDPTIPKVLYGDYVRIKQIISNILINAIKYTKEGFINLNVNYLLKDNICRLIISVEDSGIGIRDENINVLFNKFDNLNQEGIGELTGFGLPITKELVQLMKGKIVVQSKYGEGSKFIVSIDQSIVPKDIEKNNDYEDNSNIEFIGNGNKILVVDDNAINQKIIDRLLESYNVSTELVSSGKECIDKILDGNTYELILLDDIMPNMNGEQTLNNLKKIIGFNSNVVALTSNTSQDVKERFIEKGFLDCLVKPIDKYELEKILKKFLITNDDKIDSDEDEVNTNNDISLLTDNGVDINSSLELLGDMDMYNDTAQDFLNESETRLRQLKEYKETFDMPNYAILVHAMKSDSKYLGFTKLAELSYNHEMASKANDIDYVNDNYQELIQEANRIIGLVKKYIGG